MARNTRRASIWTIAYAIGPMVLVILSRRPIVDNSFLWHVTAGKVQATDGRVLTEDPFSFVGLGRPWRTQSWLVELGYASADATFGIRFGQYVAPLLGSLCFVVLAVIARRSARTGLGTALAIAASAIVLVPFMQPRPVIVSYLALAALVLVIGHGRLHWTIPLILWVWAAAHGSFPLGFVLLATEWFRTRDRSLIQGAAVGVLAVCCTAHGLGVIDVLIGFARSGDALDRITEWQAPDLLTPMFLPIVVALPLVVRYLATAGVNVRNGLPLLAWFVFGLSAIRSMPLAWIVIFPTVVLAVDDFMGTRVGTSRMPNSIIKAAIAALVGVPFLIPAGGPLSDERFPLEAVAALKQGRVFHDDVTGGFLIYTEWPERLVYVDDRAELYGEDLVAFAEARLGDASWIELFDRWGFDQALVRRDDAIASILEASPNWKSVYADENFVVYDAS